MSVYVDAAENPLGRMKMCHMLADTRDELFAMADRIGVARKWYQSFDKASCPHFDIAKSKRAFAVQNGAIELTRHELLIVIKAIKDAAIAAVLAGRHHGWETRATKRRLERGPLPGPRSPNSTMTHGIPTA